MYSIIRPIPLFAGILLVVGGCYAQEFTPKEEGETIRNVLYADQQILVGSGGANMDTLYGAIYRIDPGSLATVERRLLTTPNRLLVADIGGSFDGQLLACDNTECFLAEITDFSNMSWGVPRGMVFRDGSENVAAMFTPSSSDISELLFGESANGFFGRRFVRGEFNNVDLTGSDPPDDSAFMLTAESIEASNGEVYRYHSNFLHGDYIYFVTDTVLAEASPKPAGRVVRFCQSDSGNRRNFGSYFELKLGCHSDTTITGATFIASAPFTQPTILITSQTEDNLVYVCAYSLQSIDQLMLDKYTECIGGIGHTGFTRNNLSPTFTQCAVNTGLSSVSEVVMLNSKNTVAITGMSRGS